MEMKRLIFVLVAIVILVLISGFYKQVTYKQDAKIITGLAFLEKVKLYNINVSIIEEGSRNIGVSTDRDRLDFGILPKNARAIKIIDVKNDGEYPIKVHFVINGNISTIVEVENDVLLDAGKERNLSVKLFANEIGNYSGILQASLVTPRGWWSSWMINFV
jgi:hypothetical protein